MATNNEVIAEIKVKYEDALRAIGELKTKNDELRESEAALKKHLKEGEITRREYNTEVAASTAEINSNKNAIRVLEKEVQDSIKFDKSKEGSINQLRASLARNTAAFNAMSQAERDSVKGSMFQRAIAETTAKLKEEEQALGYHRRSVGGLREGHPEPPGRAAATHGGTRPHEASWRARYRRVPGGSPEAGENERRHG